ncbi:AMP binding protein [Hygrophoropsis aurantiaca]|uniref:AMP binding protein n=1 Tax=Hygrophoropsis aurantiaca TaxID=72124 RepID=A0ACB8ACL8_9AGAM|nr:AMP binding protein [Hygrophoropsis aurantiaca]
MSDIIYTSPYPTVHLPRQSIFTYLLGADPTSPGKIGCYPAAATAFIDAATGTTLTREALRSYALQFAHSLISPPAPLHNPKESEPTLLIFSPNSLAWPILLLGAAAAGYRATLANSAYTPAELAHQYADSGAHLIFAHPSLVGVVRAMLESLGCTEAEIRRRVVVAGSTWLTKSRSEEVGDGSPRDLKGLLTITSFLSRGKLESEVPFSGANSNTTVYMCYSSGTTGKPKGVESTHYNITSVIEILKPAFPPLTPASASPSEFSDVFFGVLPYYHIYGAIKLLQLPLAFGVPVVIMPKFDPSRFCSAVEKYRATVALIVPPILVVFARDEAIARYDLSSLKVLFSGAAPLGAELVAAVTKRLRSVGTNVTITQGYGLTETSPTIALLPVEHASRVGSAGLLLPNLEARLVKEEDGEASSSSNLEGAGELWVRGPTVMKGYLGDPTATAASITPDGWFKTGDIAVRDGDGFFTIVDRRKELIKYKGFQVPPAELESVLLQHPDVTDAAVIGVDSKEEATELPRGYIVPSSPPLKAEEFAKSVQEWVSQRVAPHKRLRGGVVLIDVVPKSAAGKILRRELRERAKQEIGVGQMLPRAKL